MNPAEGAEPGKIFVGGLSWETTKESLKAYFEQFGEVTDSVIMVDPNTKKPRGFGFITFKDTTLVGRVCNSEKHHIDNKDVEAKPAIMKSASGAVSLTTPSNQPVKKIFIGGVANTTTSEDVNAYFSQFGNVREVDLKVDRNTNRTRGFGFVEFDCEEIVDKICDTHFHQINGKTVEAKRAEPRQQGSGGGGPYSQGRGGGGAGYNMHYGNGYGRGGGGHTAYNYPSQYQTAQGGSQYGYGTAYQTTGAAHGQFAQGGAGYGNAGSYNYGAAGYPAGGTTGYQYGSQTQADQRSTDYSNPQAAMTSYGQDASSYPTATRSTYPSTGSESASFQQPYSYDTSYSQTTGYDTQGSAYARGGGGNQRYNPGYAPR